MRGSIRVLLGGIVLHALLAVVVPSPWGVPDVTLVGLVVAVALTPRRWYILAMLAGAAAMAWAVRFSEPTFVAYLAIGGAVRAASDHWDMKDGRVQGVIAAVATLFVTLEAVWLEGAWSLPLLALTGAHVAVTWLVLPVARRVLL